jgi:hypothetical protein
MKQSSPQDTQRSLEVHDHIQAEKIRGSSLGVSKEGEGKR